MPEPVSSKRWWIAPIVFGVALGIAATWMRSTGGDDSDSDGPAVTSGSAPSAVSSTIDLGADATAPVTADATAEGLDPDFVADVVADEQVTNDELAAAYEGYVGCLAANGAEGFYAYDIALRTSVNLTWSIPGETDARTAAIDAACAGSYLGDLQRRYDATPAPDDLVARQRQSIVDCLETINPEIAARVPEEITVDTAVDAASIDDLQLAPELLEPTPGELDAVSRCVSAIGAEWRPFGGER